MYIVFFPNIQKMLEKKRHCLFGRLQTEKLWGLNSDLALFWRMFKFSLTQNQFPWQRFYPHRNIKILWHPRDRSYWIFFIIPIQVRFRPAQNKLRTSRLHQSSIYWSTAQINTCQIRKGEAGRLQNTTTLPERIDEETLVTLLTSLPLTVKMPYFTLAMI